MKCDEFPFNNLVPYIKKDLSKCQQLVWLLASRWSLDISCNCYLGYSDHFPALTTLETGLYGNIPCSAPSPPLNPISKIPSSKYQGNFLSDLEALLLGNLDYSSMHVGLLVSVFCFVLFFFKWEGHFITRKSRNYLRNILDQQDQCKKRFIILIITFEIWWILLLQHPNISTNRSVLISALGRIVILKIWNCNSFGDSNLWQYILQSFLPSLNLFP